MAVLGLALLTIIGVAGLVLVRSERDITVLVTLFLVALYGINARWVVPGTGAIGTPAMIIAILMAWWWWIARPTPRYGFDRSPNPLRVALLSYLWVSCLSWGLAFTRPLSELEINGANRAIIGVIGLTGVALMISDGVDTRARLEVITRRLAVVGAAFSSVGLLQFFAGIDLVSYRLPFLALNAEIGSLGVRSDFRRAEGTALHAIEFSVVLATILPLAVYWAMRGVDTSTRQRFTLVTGLIALGIPLSVSRSAVLAVAVSLVVMTMTWGLRQKLLGFVSTIAATAAMWLLVPGLIGSLRSLFTNAGNDPSVTARIERVPKVLDEITGSSWFGSGLGTFSPDEDFLLDNQYFGTLIESGVIGLVFALSLFLAGLIMCAIVATQTERTETKHLASALAAGIAVLPVVMAVFDAFFYNILMGTTFVLLGCAGALWRIEVRDRVLGRSAPRLEMHRLALESRKRA